jgi:hypothetical protein
MGGSAYKPLGITNKLDSKNAIAMVIPGAEILVPRGVCSVKRPKAAADRRTAQSRKGWSGEISASTMKFLKFQRKCECGKSLSV